MYIIMIQHGMNNEYIRHSAWEDLEGAEKQKWVLESKGYKKVLIKFDEVVQTKDGYYFI